MRIKRWIRSSWFIEHLTLRREESLALSYWQNDDCSHGGYGNVNTTDFFYKFLVLDVLMF